MFVCRLIKISLHRFPFCVYLPTANIYCKVLPNHCGNKRLIYTKNCVKLNNIKRPPCFKARQFTIKNLRVRSLGVARWRTPFSWRYFVNSLNCQIYGIYQKYVALILNSISITNDLNLINTILRLFILSNLKPHWIRNEGRKSYLWKDVSFS